MKTIFVIFLLIFAITACGHDKGSAQAGCIPVNAAALPQDINTNETGSGFDLPTGSGFDGLPADLFCK